MRRRLVGEKLRVYTARLASKQAELRMSSGPISGVPRSDRHDCHSRPAGALSRRLWPGLAAAARAGTDERRRARSRPAAGRGRQERRSINGRGRARHARREAPPAALARPLHRTLSLAGDGGAVCAAGRRRGHAAGADRGTPHDRFRVLARQRHPDRQLFHRHDRGGGGARAVERRAILPRHHAGRAHRRRSAQRRVSPHRLALRRLFRSGQDRRVALAA